jgi:hypothetical protein
MRGMPDDGCLWVFLFDGFGDGTTDEAQSDKADMFKFQERVLLFLFLYIILPIYEAKVNEKPHPTRLLSV